MHITFSCTYINQFYGKSINYNKMFKKRLTCKTFRIDTCIIEPYVLRQFCKDVFRTII